MKLPCSLAHEAAKAGIEARIHAMRGEIGRVRAAEVEGVHDMRVASRRLRAALEGHRALYQRPPHKAVLARAKQVTRSLGVARELDVCIGILDARKGDFDEAARYALHHVRRNLLKLRNEQTPDVTHAADLVEAPQFEVESHALFASTVPTDTCYLEHASGVILEAYDALGASYQKWRKTHEEEDLHAARIAFKKLRYHCELYDGLYDDWNKDFIKQLKNAQEALGTWNDYRILRDYARQFAEEAPPRASQGMPRFLAELDKEVIALLERFEKDSKRFFSKSRQRGVHAYFRWPGRRCCMLPAAARPKGESQS